MVLVLTACILVMVMSAGYVWYLSLRAPEGFEDEAGFHQTAESELTAKTSNQISPVPLKRHDDHEPIAA
jgi:hypothetical protein